MRGSGLAVCRGTGTGGGEIICGAQSIGEDNVLEREAAQQLTVHGEERGDAENKDAQVIEQDVLHHSHPHPHLTRRAGPVCSARSLGHAATLDAASELTTCCTKFCKFSALVYFIYKVTI